jgi:hypothetical protein
MNRSEERLCNEPCWVDLAESSGMNESKTRVSKHRNPKLAHHHHHRPNRTTSFDTKKETSRNTMIVRLRLVHLLLLLISGFQQSSAWVPSLPSSQRRAAATAASLAGPRLSLSSTTTTSSDNSITSRAAPLAKEEDDEDEEYEYVEYDNLTEKELVGSEWLVGTCWDNRNDIQETWCRLVVDAAGKNVAIWGDDSTGNWNLDVASQFLGISKENKFTGKVIWAATVDDYYYLQGTVRGWRFWSPAAVLGQWQARRLGIDKDEAGIAPWFQTNDAEDENETATTAGSES